MVTFAKTRFIQRILTEQFWVGNSRDVMANKPQPCTQMTHDGPLLRFTYSMMWGQTDIHGFPEHWQHWGGVLKQATCFGILPIPLPLRIGFPESYVASCPPDPLKLSSKPFPSFTPNFQTLRTDSYNLPWDNFTDFIKENPAVTQRDHWGSDLVRLGSLRAATWLCRVWTAQRHRATETRDSTHQAKQSCFCRKKGPLHLYKGVI